MSLTVERPFHLASQSGRTGGIRRQVREGPEPEPEQAVALPPGRVPRIAKLMALAIHCDQLIRSGAVADASALARVAQVSQVRMTQIMNLNLLAPDIQEELLFMPSIDIGRSYINEKQLRPIIEDADWGKQRLTTSALMSNR